MSFNKKITKISSVGILFSLVFSFIFPLTTFAVSSTTVVLPATQDAYINEDPVNRQDLNTFGTSTEIFVQTVFNARRYGLVRFDLSSIPKDATITSASLLLFMTTTPSIDRIYNLYHINDTADWNENTVTWDIQPQPSPIINTTTVVSSTTVSSTAVNKDISWDVTPEVLKMFANTINNQGWKITDSIGDTSPVVFSIFKSKEGGGATQGPRLSITYTQPEPIIATASTSGTVFNDLNGDGFIQSGENGLSGWTINLSGATASSTVTNASGGYIFNGLSNGTYHICEVIPTSTPAFVQTFPTSGFACGSGVNGFDITIDTASSTSVTDKNFGNQTDAIPPVSSIISPLASSTISATLITITGSTTDNHFVASTTLQYAPSASTSTTTPNDSCGAFIPITTLVNPTFSSKFNWTFDWTPPNDGSFCLKAIGQDTVGNIETGTSSLIKNVTFKLVTPPPPAPVPVSTGGGGGNGPIVGSLTSSSFGSGNTVVSNVPTTVTPIVTAPETVPTAPTIPVYTVPTVGEGPALTSGNQNIVSKGTQKKVTTPQQPVIAQNVPTSTTPEVTVPVSNQVAQVASSTSFFTLGNSLLVLLFIIILGVIVFLAIR